MKAAKIVPIVFILIGILLNACAAAPSAPPASSGAGIEGQLLVSEVVFTGVIEGMDDTYWVIDGQTIQVDNAVVRDGPFVAGDTVKVEALVAADGSLTARRIESPSPADLAGTPASPVIASSTEMPLVFDDSRTEAFGTIEAITDTSVTIGGQTFPFMPGVEIKGLIGPGTVVKLHFFVSADGTLAVREIEVADPAQIGNANGNDDNSNANGDDDNSNSNSNEDNSNDDNGNGDDGNSGNSNDNDDDDDDDDNSNDSNDNG